MYRMPLKKNLGSAVAPSMPAAAVQDARSGKKRADSPACVAFVSYVWLIVPMAVAICTTEVLVQQPMWLNQLLGVSSWLPRGSLAWAVLDEAAHGIAASCVWGCIARAYRQHIHSKSSLLWVHTVAFLVGVSIDVDHYIWGALLYGDISVHRARSLGAVRPLPHCVPIMLVCAICAAAVAHRCSRRLGLSHGVPLRRASRGWLLLFLTAWSLHLLRDGIHRGVWLFPTSTAFSTGLVPAPLYIGAVCATPWVLLRFLPTARKAKATCTPPSPAT